MSERANQKLRLLDLLLNEEGIQSPAKQAIPQRKSQTEFPLSFAQNRLWFLNHLEPGPHYNDHFNLRFKGPLNAAVLQACLDEIVRRHEALRARFVVEHGEPVQKPLPPGPVPMPFTDLSTLPENERMSRTMAIAVEDGRALFDLQSGPLFRVQLLRLAPDDHLLIFTLHHIVIDGWSRGVFLRELTALYPALLAGKPSPLPPLPIQYADFAIWQQEWMQNENLQQQLSYWKKQLTGAPALLDWPADFTRPEILTYRGARFRIRFPKSLADALNALSQREGCTLFMTLLAAFQTLAARYTRQEEIVVGTPIANRNRFEIEGLIGAFVNTLVLRTNVGGSPTFREVLARVRETALAAYAHQDLPFEKLVGELHPERNQSYNPIFQVMFIFQNAPMPVMKIPGNPTLPNRDWRPTSSSLAPTGGEGRGEGAGHRHHSGELTIEPFEIDAGIAKFDLTVNLEETAAGIEGWIEFATDLFRPETIERLGDHYRILLEAIAANPNQPIATLPLLSSAERNQVLVEWNQTQAEYPQDRCFHELFKAQALRTPQATALVFRDSRLSYGQLNEKADRVAAHLRSLGLGPDTLVGLCLERSLEMVVGLLGILKAGAAYVPLDPNYPPERLAFILEDAQVPVLLTQESLLGNLPKPTGAFAPRVLCLDPELSAFEGKGEAQVQPTPDNLAYVLYTSGSTGKPKGVQIPHRALVNFLASMARQPGINAADVLLAVTTLSFDIAGLELWLPLSVGAQVVIAESDTAREGKRLAQQLEACGATLMQATPVTWRLLLESGWKGLPHLKVLCGGEAWGLELAQALVARCGSVWNMYGPTETTIWSAAIRVNSGETPMVGGPIANTQLYVLDDQLQPVPLGVPGELFIGGDGLARGYLNRPELTKEKFIPDPFQQGGRLYRTGDLVRHRPDGRLEFLGRLDHQVKIRGFRIELGEIEALLRTHPNVREAVVVAKDDLGGDKRLVAYVVARQQPAPTPRELQSLLTGHLPSYMTPSAFVLLDALPLTPNGKVDRKALPEPENRPELSSNYAAPSTPMEKTVAEIWASVLHLEKVGVNDNFFDLGGHSLLLARVHARLCESLKIHLPIVRLFQYPTIASLAANLSQAPTQAPTEESSSVARARQRARLQREAMSGQARSTP